MDTYHCKNQECKYYHPTSQHLCPDCKVDARTLDHKYEYNLRMEALNYIPKNDGQHKRRGKGRR